MSAAKAYIAAIIAALTAVLARGADQLPWWVVLIIGGIIAGLATFAVPNTPTATRKK